MCSTIFPIYLWRSWDYISQYHRSTLNSATEFTDALGRSATQPKTVDNRRSLLVNTNNDLSSKKFVLIQFCYFERIPKIPSFMFSSFNKTTRNIRCLTNIAAAQSQGGMLKKMSLGWEPLWSFLLSWLKNYDFILELHWYIDPESFISKPRIVLPNLSPKKLSINSFLKYHNLPLLMV